MRVNSRLVSTDTNVSCRWAIREIHVVSVHDHIVLNRYCTRYKHGILSFADLFITSKIPVRWPGQCYGFTLSLIFKYCGGI